MSKYVHGYSEREAQRLKDQANTLDSLLHHDSVWEEGSQILEAGCGVGAQTKIIAPANPESKFVSIDISNESLAIAEEAIRKQKIENVIFKQADIFNLPFEEDYFDHIFVCFVLEHLTNPIDALMELKRVLKPSGTIMIIEGDHGSTYFYPESKEALEAVQCQVILQKQNGGDANIGRKLFPLLKNASFQNISISPRMVYADDSKPELVEGFTRNTFTAMIEGISEKAISANLISDAQMKKGVADLYKTAEGGGTFCYTFFKGIAIK
ncbi:MAG TPA: methyltransferase domain-containing protein [Prolixibacteraceae bacterium]|nr:methyltransferase domain-containing protein [Prolixibacteraceae bacterium]